MPNLSLLSSIVQRLPLRVESQSFVVRYGLRTPEHGDGLGSHGVSGTDLIARYLEVMERLHHAMTSPPHNRPPPLVGTTGKTIVYVFDTSQVLYGDGAFTSVDWDGIPFVALASRNHEPSLEVAFARAEAEAVHEMAHVFNCREHSLLDLSSKSWEWLDEAIAVSMELEVLCGNHDCLRFYADWVDMPETSLDVRSARYQCGMFAQYLAHRIGPDFVNEVWTQSRSGETAIEALARLSRARGLELVSSDPAVNDLFAFGYCVDSYFVWHTRRSGLLSLVSKRFGERAVAYSWVLDGGDRIETVGSLDHLACRYYRCYVRPDVRHLEVQVQTETVDAHTPLKAAAVTVTRQKRRGRTVHLMRVAATSPEGRVVLSAEITGLQPQELDHIVLVVSNCGLRADDGGTTPHDDAQGYSIVARAF